MIIVSRLRRRRCRLTKIVDELSSQPIEDHPLDIRWHRRDLHNHMYAIAPLDLGANYFKTARISTSAVDVVEHEISGVGVSVAERASKIHANESQRRVPNLVDGIRVVVGRARERDASVHRERENERRHSEQRTNLHTTIVGATPLRSNFCALPAFLRGRWRNRAWARRTQKV